MAVAKFLAMGARCRRMASRRRAPGGLVLDSVMAYRRRRTELAQLEERRLLR